MSYEWIDYLDIKAETEPGWFSFKWKPVKHTGDKAGTWNIYRTRHYRDHRTCGFKLWTVRGYNGTSKGLTLQIDWWFGGFEAWVAYAFIMSAHGPVDVGAPKPMCPEKIKTFREKST